MTVSLIRRKLFDYIRDADEEKVRAIYTMVENDISAERNIWNDDFVNEMKKRRKEYKSGHAKGYTWEEVQQKAMNKLKSAGCK